jgi:hypothetical protein
MYIIGPRNQNVRESEKWSLHRPRALHAAAEERSKRNPECAFQSTTPRQAQANTEAFPLVAGRPVPVENWRR